MSSERLCPGGGTVTNGSLQIRVERMGCISMQPKLDRIIDRPRKIYQSPEGNNFNIDIELKTCVHGKLSRFKRQPASLIIIGVQFACLRKHGTFKRMRLQLDFEDFPGIKGTSHPEIVSHAPFEFERQNITEIDVQQTDGVQRDVSATINLGGAKGGANEKVSHVKVENYKDTYFGQAATATVTNEKGVHSSVWWNVKQSTNPHTKDDAGIQPSYRFAVLLTRQDDSDFQARLHLVVDAGWRHRVKNHFSQRMPVSGEGPNITFSPAIQHYEGNCTGIDRKRLGRFKDRAELQQLTHASR
jgi:hypothetical protein